MAIPQNDREAGIWLEAIADFVDDGDIERALLAISEVTTFYVLLNCRFKERDDGKAQARFQEVRSAVSRR